MENIWTLVFTTSATKALSGYRHIAEILTSSHNHSEASKLKRVLRIRSCGCLLTIYFVRYQKEIATFFNPSRLIN